MAKRGTKSRKWGASPKHVPSAAGDEALEEALDEALEETFPASDPIAVDVHPDTGPSRPNRAEFQPRALDSAACGL